MLWPTFACLLFFAGHVRRLDGLRTRASDIHWDKYKLNRWGQGHTTHGKQTTDFLLVWEKLPRPHPCSRSYPSSWEAGKHPVCSVPQGHCTALSAPAPGQTHQWNYIKLEQSGRWRWWERGSTRTWVVAVMESTNVGTVEQLRLSRRPWRARATTSVGRTQLTPGFKVSA